MKQIWERFRCNNPACAWETYGTYQGRDGTWGSEGTVLPDTDCPKCGFHDSVSSDEGDWPQPEDLSTLTIDQNTGPYSWGNKALDNLKKGE
jgi:hypothetical protein